MSAYNLLALETSTERLSLAILRGERMFVREVDAGQRHSELTLPLMHELLDEAGKTLAEIDVFAFGQGPGSFTGVRIACGLVQGLALGAGKPVIPVPTQMALAERCGAGKVLVAIDARMGEIYFAAYERAVTTDDWTEVFAPALVRPAELPPLAGDAWLGIGSGFDVPALAGQLWAHYGGKLGHITPDALPGAREVATIAARQLARRGMQSALAPEHAAPLYLRNRVAMTIAERVALRAKVAAE